MTNNSTTRGNNYNVRNSNGKFVSTKDILDNTRTIKTVGQLEEAISEIATSVFNQEQKYTSEDILMLKRISEVMLKVNEHREAMKTLRKLKSK